MARSCLIIGAGLAGLAAGRCLQTAGWEVTILDKGRQPGGRMATRTFAGATFDHGAQFFTVRDQLFAAEVERWLADGIAKPWFSDDGGHTRYAGVGGMLSISQYLAQGLPVQLSEHVESVDPGWTIATRTGTHRADAVIATAPIEQTLQMLHGDGPNAIQVPARVGEMLQLIMFEPCFAVMALLSQASLVPAPGYIRPQSGPIAWIADNHQKGISALPAVTIHAKADFTRAFWDAPRDEVGDLLVKAATAWLFAEDGGGEVLERQVHRWKYSMPVGLVPEPCLMITEPGPLVFAGDAFGGPRIEGAYLSGIAAAEMLIKLPPDSTN